MKKYIILNVILGLLLTNFTLASGGGGGGGGGFSGGGGGGGSKPREVDREKFNLGRSVFSQKAELAPKVISRDLYRRQARTLVRLQKKIARVDPEALERDFMPRELAGRMSSKQLNALSYYVKHHYK